jgi:hypothetical protein
MARKKSNYNKRKVLRTKRRGKRKRTTKRRRSRKQRGGSSLLRTADLSPGNILPDPEIDPMRLSEPQAPKAGGTFIHRPTQAQVRKSEGFGGPPRSDPGSLQRKLDTLPETQERNKWGLGKQLSSETGDHLSIDPLTDPEAASLPPLKPEEVSLGEHGGTRLPNKLSNLVQEEYTEIKVGDIIVPTGQYNQIQAWFYDDTNRPPDEVPFAMASGHDLHLSPEHQHAVRSYGPPGVSFFRVTDKPPPHSGDGGGGGAGLPGMSTFKLTVLPVNKDLKPIATPEKDVAWRGQVTNWIGPASRRVARLGPKAFNVMKFTWAYKGSPWSGEAGVPEIVRQLTEASEQGRFGLASVDSVILHSNQIVWQPSGSPGAEAHFLNSGVAAQWLCGVVGISPNWTDYKGPGARAASWLGSWVGSGGGSGKRTKPRKRRRRRRR